MCGLGVLKPMISRKGKYFPVNVYNQMKEIFFKHWKEKSLLGIYLSEDIPSLTDHEISERNIKCEICTRQQWNDISKKYSH